jgi:sugar (pentulose or hexulose) kinase
MTGIRRLAVIDIGKTNAKVVLVDLATQAEIEIRSTPNEVTASGAYPHHDVGRLWLFVKEALASLAVRSKIDAIVVTTHGATAALVKADGSLALPVLDYEHDGPAALAQSYAEVRPGFGETGSPRLPNGLNLGAQLFWQSRAFPDRFAEVSSILPYPQYWAFRLSGVAAAEATSLGCHTDLWDPARRDWSSLVDHMGWRDRMPALRLAADCLGPVLPGLAAELGLDPGTPVLCGIHDSNASLYPHLVSRSAPFSVVSTGTWVVVLSVGGALDHLDPERDCLVNVDARGDPVPSARFMGGREYSLALGREAAPAAGAAAGPVLDAGIMLLPSLVAGCGPFPASRWRWLGEEASLDGGMRSAAVSFYLAMMTATCLELTGGAGPVIIEGPFARNAPYLDMLGVAAGRPVLASGGSVTGTSLGAALLAEPGTRPRSALDHVPPHPQAEAMARYFARWKDEVQRR